MTQVGSEVLFGLGCSVMFVAVVSAIWLIVGFYKKRKVEIDFFNAIEKAIIKEVNEEDTNEVD